MDEYSALFGKVIMPPVFRDYDGEDEFINNMGTLAEYWLHNAVVVWSDNPKSVGLCMIFLGEAANDNQFRIV